MQTIFYDNQLSVRIHNIRDGSYAIPCAPITKDVVSVSHVAMETGPDCARLVSRD